MASITLLLSVLAICSFVGVSLQASTPDSDSYVAAVVEYSPISGATLENAEQIFLQNVAQYISFMQQAANGSADIVVFPEVGLASMGVPLKEDGTPAFAVEVPTSGANPCVDTDLTVAEGLKQLSCGARTHGLYVVVNLPERENCSSIGCSSTGALFHNTNVVFDRNGSIVARYRKYNLYGEDGFVATEQPEHITFDTDFGVRFGVFICFDMMFEEPAVVVAREQGVCDFVFSTAWFSEAPFLVAVQEQAAWSYSLDVNLLASGYNKPIIGSAGSGIYLGNSGVLEVVMPTENTNRLLIGTVPKKSRCRDVVRTMNVGSNGRREIQLNEVRSTPRKGKPVARKGTPLTTGTVRPASRASYFSGLYLKRDNLDVYSTVLLESNITLELCHNTFCCSFSVEYETEGECVGDTCSPSGRYFYRLAAFDGVRSFDGAANGGLQVCALIPCSSSNLTSCGELSLSDEAAQATVFRHISLSGTFRSNHTQTAANTLTLGVLPMPADRFSFSSQQVADDLAFVNMTTTGAVREEGLSLYTFAIYSRDFTVDDQPATTV